MDEMRTLLDVLAEVRDDVDFAREEALVDDGIIDSLDLTQIMLALDDAFSVHIPAGEIGPENFNSARAMLDLVHSLQKQ